MDRASTIKEGYSEEQVLQALGKPDEQSGENWIYRWGEPNERSTTIFFFHV